MPSLTVQYMSDSGTVELSRDCGEEGTRHMPCRGRADHEAILNELNCIDGSSSTTVTESTVTLTTTTTKSRTTPSAEIPASTSVNKEILHLEDKTFNLKKSLSIENAEDNNIDNNISQIETPAERHRPAKISIEDFMMGDQPSIEMQGHNLDREMVAKKIIREMPKKVQAKDKWLKKQYTKVLKLKKNNDEEIMLGDQPIADEMKPLPHTKKSLAIDLKHHVEPTDPPRSSEDMIKLETVTTSSTTVAPISSSTAETRLRRETEISPDDQNVTGMSTHIPTTETSLNTVNVHPPKISSSLQKPHHSHNDGITAITSHDVKEKLDVHESIDHFIPPMLLVRTKFTTSSRSHTESPIQDEITVLTTLKAEPHNEDTSTMANHIQTSAPVSSTTETSTTTLLATSTEAVPPFTITTSAPKDVSMLAEATETILNVQEDTSNVVNSSITTTTTTESINQPLSTVSTPHSIEHHTVEASETAHTIVADLPKFRQPHAPQRTAELLIRPSSNIESNTATTELPSITPTNGATPFANDISVTTLDQTASNIQHSDETTMSSSHVTDNLSNPSTSPYASSDSTTGLGSEGTFSSTEDNDNVSDFTNANNFQPYRPNRRRTLTKPETHNYMKKILG